MVLDIEPMITPEYVSGATIQERFEEFHRLNGWVLTALEEMTQDLIDHGRHRIAVKMLVEVLRYQHDTTTTGDAFKLNNSYTSRYVRRMVERHPEWEEYFVRRELKVA
jgi:hypothetical protein